jgi:RNA polymerase sigma factor (sigma-70 family)
MNNSEFPYSGSCLREFPDTQWSVILNAAEKDSESASEGIRKLYQAYAGPLYVFARRRGQSPDDAMDLTQGFFMELLQKNLVRSASAEKGRFRSFLLTAFKRFYSDQKDRAQAMKRGGRAEIISVEEMMVHEKQLAEVRELQTPESAYDVKWARTVVNNAFRRLRFAYEAAGNQEPLLYIQDYIQFGRKPNYAQISRRSGKSESAVRLGFRNLEKRLKKAMLEELSYTVADEEEIREELRYLLGILKNAPPG